MTITTKLTTNRFKLFKAMSAPGALALAAVFLWHALPVSAEPGSVSAAERKGRLFATKECSTYTGAAGEFCTITTSNLGPMPVGAKVFYHSAAGIPSGMLDTDVILDAGSGNRAVGHCTLDLATGQGLCTFSDGTGRFAGFKARVEVTYEGGPNWRWEGTYKFAPRLLKAERDRDN